MENIKLIFREDGYINATQLCKAGVKELSEWIRSKRNQSYMKKLSERLNIPTNELLQYNANTAIHARATWVHPLIATNIAQWISSDFAIDVSIWIEEWKSVHNNKEIYNEKISNLTPDFKNDKEKQIQLRLQKELGGKIEVETESGFIDLLTDSEIIEIKEEKNWKHAIGQIIAYSIDYPTHQRRIHLFDAYPNKIINKVCRENNIIVTYES